MMHVDTARLARHRADLDGGREHAPGSELAFREIYVELPFSRHGIEPGPRAFVERCPIRRRCRESVCSAPPVRLTRPLLHLRPDVARAEALLRLGDVVFTVEGHGAAPSPTS